MKGDEHFCWRKVPFGVGWGLGPGMTGWTERTCRPAAQEDQGSHRPLPASSLARLFCEVFGVLWLVEIGGWLRLFGRVVQNRWLDGNIGSQEGPMADLLYMSPEGHKCVPVAEDSWFSVGVDWEGTSAKATVIRYSDCRVLSGEK